MDELLNMDEQALKIWLLMANLKDLRSWCCFVVGGKSLNNLAPKFAGVRLNLSLGSLRLPLLPSLVTVFNFSDIRLWSIIGLILQT